MVEKLDAGFELRPEFVSLATETVRKIVEQHEKKMAASGKKKKSKKDKKSAATKKKEENFTFVGIHSRYSST